jgi:hypothetical protein
MPRAEFDWTKAAVNTADNVAPKITDNIQLETPVRTGRLQSSIYYRRYTTFGEKIRMEFVSQVPYAKYVVYGTGMRGGWRSDYYQILPIPPNTVLRFVVNGEVVFARKVMHPGIKANNFPARGWERVREEVVDEIRDQVRRALKIVP